MEAGLLDRRVMIEAKWITRDANFGAEVVAWSEVATLWASVEDQLDTGTGGGERVREKERVLSRRTRIVVRWRSGITSDMRVRLLDRSRIFQITSLAEMVRNIAERAWADPSCCERGFRQGGGATELARVDEFFNFKFSARIMSCPSRLSSYAKNC